MSAAAARLPLEAVRLASRLATRHSVALLAFVIGVLLAVSVAQLLIVSVFAGEDLLLRLIVTVPIVLALAVTAGLYLYQRLGKL